jgi:hypothetical protein
MASNDEARSNWHGVHYAKVSIKYRDGRPVEVMNGVTGIYFQVRDIVLYVKGTGRPTRIKRDSVLKMLCE